MIGDTLRREREKQNLTVKDIEEGTSIRSLYIEAIESGEYDTLPGEVYTKGFIRNYAKFVHIDPEACIHQYLDERGVLNEDPVDAEEYHEAPPVKHKQSKTKQRNRPGKNIGGNGATILVAAMLLAVVGGAYLIFDMADDKRADRRSVHPAPVASARGVTLVPEEEASSPESQARFSSSTATTTETAPAPVTAAPAVPAAGGVAITAQFLDQCWTRVEADGNVVYEGIPSAGDTMTWKGKDRVAVTMGNAGAIDLTYNGQKLGKPGATGQVVEKVFTVNGAN